MWTGRGRRRAGGAGAPPRCAVPGLAHSQDSQDGGVPADPALLATLARHYPTDLPGLGRAACFGTYAEVLQPGRIQVGQDVR